MADLSNPLAEAIVKVKLDPTSFNQMRSQLEGMGKGAQNQVAQGIGGTAATAAAAGAGVKLAEAFSKGFSGKGVGASLKKDISSWVNIMDEFSRKHGKGIIEQIAIGKGAKGEFTGFHVKMGGTEAQALELQGMLNKYQIAKDNYATAKQTTKEYREMARAAYQLRGGILEVAGILRNIALPAIGLMVMGIRKFMQTSGESSLELRKSFGGLMYSWNQFLARVGDVANKSLGLNKIFKTMKGILDGMGKATIGTILNVALWTGVLSIILGIKAGILGLYGSIMRATSGLVKFVAAFKLAQATSGKTGWGGFMAGMGGVTGGKIGAVGIGALVASASALLLAAFVGFSKAWDNFIYKLKTGATQVETEGTKWASIMQKLDAVLSYLGNFLKNIAIMMVNLGENALAAILDYVMGFFKALKGIFTLNLKTILEGQEQMRGTGKLMKDWAKDLWAAITGKPDEDKGGKYSFMGTTSTVGFGDLNRIAQEMADNSMIMASENMIKAADKMNEAADKMNGGNGSPMGSFSVAFGT